MRMSGRTRALVEIEKFQQLCKLLPTPMDIIERIHALVPVVAPKGPELFDLAIATIALAGNIHEIYTYDDNVFRRVPDFKVRIPS